MMQEMAMNLLMGVTTVDINKFPADRKIISNFDMLKSNSTSN